MKSFRTYLLARARSFVYAFRGIGLLFSTQANARIHLFAMAMIGAIGWFFHLSPLEWALIAICTGIVLAAEAINSAIEFLTDLASPDIHPLAEKTKDLAAGAVLITVIFGGIVWGIIHVPKIIHWLLSLSTPGSVSG